MYMKLTTYFADVIGRLRSEEDGLALTEYLILLGLLTGAVVAAVLLFGTNLGLQWDAWADWLTGLDAPDPIL